MQGSTRLCSRLFPAVPGRPVPPSPLLPVPRCARQPAHVQPTHARASHQLRHAVDYYNRVMTLFIEFKGRNKTRGILSIHDMDDENNVGLAKIVFDFTPLAVA